MTYARAAASEGPVHYPSHASLLRRARPGRMPLDAIVVSAGRRVGNLRPAVKLGAELAVPVVVICSRDARSDDAEGLVSELPGGRCVIVDLSRQDLRPSLPPFGTSRFGEAIVGVRGDLDLKRNLGLLLGRLSGWTTLLFLDDDIRGVSAELVQRAAGTLEHHAAAGLPPRAYPDNSVVCHARRIAGKRQGVFVSGSALAVHLERTHSFFPEIYNEDWLFLAHHLDRRDVAVAGRVRQLRYRPFEAPDRATAQEFGDVVAEGLISFLHRASLKELPTVEYWAGFLRRRAEFIAEAVDGCTRRAGTDPQAVRALKALERAERVRGRIPPDVLADYVVAWRADHLLWRDFLLSFPRTGDIEAGLDRLRLPAVTVPPRSSSRHRFGET